MTMTKNDQTLERLIHTRRLISRGFTKKVFARDFNGHQISADSIDAHSWCIAGAINRTFEGEDLAEDKIGRHIRKLIYKEINYYPSISKWNDKWYRTKASVLRMLDRVINKLKAEINEPRQSPS